MLNSPERERRVAIVCLMFFEIQKMGCVRKSASLVVAMVGLTVSLCLASTDHRDVEALNSLYATLGFPPLTGWEVLGGDPCGDQWQGISCVFSNVTAIKLNGMNLGGSLNDDLGLLASVIEIDLRNNQIGGRLPSALPQTLKNFSLSNNELSGNIPDTFSSLTQLLHLSLHNNPFTGEIPDIFEELTSLIHLDLSANNLTGQLPPSMGNLSALYTLHLQNNSLIGFLDVLQDLPLNELNVENNQFSGPVPHKLMNIPIFSKEGNPFNTTIIPSSLSPPSIAVPPSMALAPSPVKPPTSMIAPRNVSSGKEHSQKGGISLTFNKAIRIIVITAIVIVVIFAIGACFLMLRCCKRQVKTGAVGHGSDSRNTSIEKSPMQLNKDVKNGGKEVVLKMPDEDSIFREVPDRLVKRVAASSRHVNEEKPAMSNVGLNAGFTKMPLPPPLPTILTVNKVTVDPVVSETATIETHTTKDIKSSCSVKTFTVAILQQCTNSFSEENFIGEGMLGSVYWAELPGGRLAAVKKLMSTATKLHNDEEFDELVNKLSKLKHANVVKLIGYCNEHSQRLLVYKYFNSGTLYDALHTDDEVHKQLSWNARIHIALGSAKALQYLHETCQPPIVHQNFKCANILLDDKLAVGVSDCGLAPFILSSSASQLSLNAYYGYGAPESESGNFTGKSDVYSFGVVMLELLTGRKAYDRSRNRGEQSLVRWAIPQLHDIDALSMMVDPFLAGAYPAKSLSRFADIISRCVQFEPEFRPAMSEIVQDLLPMI